MAVCLARALHRGRPFLSVLVTALPAGLASTRGDQPCLHHHAAPAGWRGLPASRGGGGDREHRAGDRLTTNPQIVARGGAVVRVYNAGEASPASSAAASPPSTKGDSLPSLQAPPLSESLQTKLESAGNNAALVRPSVRRLATTTVSPGAGTLQAAVNAASAGDTLVLADGDYTGSGTNVLEISKDITIRAQNSGQAVVDGQNARRVVHITSGTVALEGLKITKGYASVSTCPAWHVVAYDLSLRARLPNVPRPFPPSQTPPNTPPCPVPLPLS